MSMPLQSKLLHVLQGDDYTPLGSEKPIKTDVWIIVATNRNLEKDMQSGHFRSDLYYRLSNVTITIEPLRRRPEDIPVLIEHYIRRYVAQYPGREFTGLSAAAIEKLSAYPWPGNVRELQNVLKRLIVLGESESALDKMLVDMRLPAPSGAGESADKGLLTPGSFLESESDKVNLATLSLKKIRKRASDHVEKTLISHVLIRTGWNRSKASRILKVSYKTLLQKIDALEIAPPPELA
jgi:DNA-binding NtrC family response regulator